MSIMTLQTRKKIIDTTAFILLCLGVVVMAGPFVWMVSTALKEPADQFSKSLIPSPMTSQNFFKLFEVLPVGGLLFNSLKIATLATMGQLLTCSMAGFVFAVVRFRFREPLFVALLATLMIPPQMSYIPDFIIFKYIGILGTQMPLWLPAFWGGAFGTFLLRQFFLTIPIDLAEAARVDGASLLRIFWNIYLPLAKPALAALTIFTFLFSWNDLLGPLIYLPADLEKTTITVGLALFQTQYGGKWTLMMAGSLISILPIIIIFFFAQRQFIEGIALSGVKS
jgi:ABC-type glycerol-3-phosphate transport system permease component